MKQLNEVKEVRKVMEVTLIKETPPGGGVYLNKNIKADPMSNSHRISSRITRMLRPNGRPLLRQKQSPESRAEPRTVRGRIDGVVPVSAAMFADDQRPSRSDSDSDHSRTVRR